MRNDLKYMHAAINTDGSKSDDRITSVAVIGHQVVYFRLPFEGSICTAKAKVMK